MSSGENEHLVRALWEAYEREGIEGLRRYVDDDVEWSPHGMEPFRGVEALTAYWRSAASERSAVPHVWEQHGECVLVHGSLRTFRDGGFVDVQPSWVYFFRAARLRKATAFSSREEALAEIARYEAQEDAA